MKNFFQKRFKVALRSPIPFMRLLVSKLNKPGSGSARFPNNSYMRLGYFGSLREKVVLKEIKKK
jgi:hypothetical protein